MGNCFNDNEDDLVFQGFRNDIADNEMDYEKICLLGLASSGKSTLYLNLRQLYTDTDYNHEQQLKHCAAIIRSNCLLYIAVLINEAEKLLEKTQNDLYFIDYQNKSIHDAIQLITRYIPYKFDLHTPQIPPSAPQPHVALYNKPLRKPVISNQAKQSGSQLQVVEEKKITLDDDESELHPLKIEQVVLDSSSFLDRFNIDESQLNESKNMMDDEDGSYLTMDNADSNKIQIVEIPRNDMPPEEEKQGQYAEELAFLMNEYDEYGFFDEMGLDVWSFGQFGAANMAQNNWKTKYNAYDHKGYERKARHQFEGYKAFDFDAFYKQQKEWEKIQRSTVENKKNNNHGLKYFDEESECSSDAYYEELFGLKRVKRPSDNEPNKVLNEELIDDFGAYFEHNKANRSTHKQDIKPWSDFGHKAAMLSHYFNMKLNDAHNPIKHEYQLIGDLWWSNSRQHNGKFTMKKLEIVLQNKRKITRLSQYDSEEVSSDDEELDVYHDKQLMYKIEIVDGKIKRREEWDKKVMSNKEMMLSQLTQAIDGEQHNELQHKTISMDTVEVMECKEEKKEDLHENDRKASMALSASNTALQNTSMEQNTVEVNGEKISIKQFWNDMKKLGESVKKIWNLPAIQQIYLKRYNLFYMPSNMDYWFYNATKIFSPDFKSTNQHLSLYRDYNTKVQTFKHNGMHGPKLKIYDIPGTTPEIRDKYWNREYCANSDAVIFTVSLVDIFHVSFENPTKNAFYLAIELFYEILHAKWLNKGCKMILFLTHRDRLIEYIRSGHSIQTFANYFNEWRWRPNGSDSNHDHEVHSDDDKKENKSKSTKSIDKTVNTIDAMHNTFERFIQSMEEKENIEKHKNTVSEMDASINKERDGTITKFMPELSQDIEIEILSEEDPPIVLEQKLVITSSMEATHERSNGDTVADIIATETEDIKAKELKEEEIELKMEEMIDLNAEKKEEIMQKEEEEEDKLWIRVCKCPQGHDLEKISCITSNAYVCDYCGEDLGENMDQYQCRMDNYDLCEKCHAILLLREREKVEKELKRTPVWVLDEYKGVEFIDRLNTPQSDLERELIMNDNVEITPDSKERRITPDSNSKEVEEEKEKENKILFQFKKQTKKQNKMTHSNDNKILDNAHDENWKYILSGNKKLTYDGSTFDDDRWLIETYDGYCEWIRDCFMKCKDANDHRMIHCHTVNLVNQDDVEKVMYDVNNYVFRSFQNDWMF